MYSTVKDIAKFRYTSMIDCIHPVAKIDDVAEQHANLSFPSITLHNEAFVYRTYICLEFFQMSVRTNKDDFQSTLR